MSSITEPQTFLDLQNDFIYKMKESATTTMTEVAKRFINIALVNMHRNPGANFSWPERPGVLITHAPYSTGTVTIVTATSRTAVTGASTLWTTTVPGFAFANVRAGGKIKFQGDIENYTVASVSAAGTLALETSYVGSDISSGTYYYYEDTYALATDFEEFVDMRMFSTDMEIPLMGRTDFRRMFSRNDTTQRPKVATHIQVDFSGSTATQHRVILHPPPDQIYQIPYWYKSNYLAVSTAGVRQSRLILDTDEPIVPIGKRQAISLYAMYEYMLYIKDDERAGAVKGEYAEFIKRVAGEKTASDARPQMIVRRRGQGYPEQRYDWGNRADTLGDFRRWNR